MGTAFKQFINWPGFGGFSQAQTGPRLVPNCSSSVRTSQGKDAKTMCSSQVSIPVPGPSLLLEAAN